MPTLTAHVALVPYETNITLDFLAELTEVSAALQKQITRDVGPIWDIDATVDVFTSLEALPLDYWPVIVGNEPIPDQALGVHLDEFNQPFALVARQAGWSITASHETIEMLVDPYGNRFVAGQSPDPQQGRVLFLVEACDPCEAADYAYTINNNILVSDFYTPHYFDPVAASGVRYDYQGQIEAPRTVLPGGYLSWRNPVDGRYYQLRDIDGNSQIVMLEEMARRGSIREAIDHTPGTPRAIYGGIPERAEPLVTVRTRAAGMRRLTENWSAGIRRQIEAYRRS